MTSIFWSTRYADHFKNFCFLHRWSTSKLIQSFISWILTQFMWICFFLYPKSKVNTDFSTFGCLSIPRPYLSMYLRFTRSFCLTLWLSMALTYLDSVIQMCAPDLVQSISIKCEIPLWSVCPHILINAFNLQTSTSNSTFVTKVLSDRSVQEMDMS